MPLRRLAREARAAFEVPRDLLLGRYPEFVTGGPLPRGHVPVFVFHSVEPESFARKMHFLAENGYRTLSCEEYLRMLLQATPPPERGVVLTFDDGRASVRTVAMPILKRHGLKAVVFLIPGRTPSRPGPLPPTWDDVKNKAARPEAILGRDEASDGLLSWEEIADLEGTGLFEFQSHTLRHSRIHTSPQVAAFLTPDLQRGYRAMDAPLLRDGEKDLLASEAPLGTPLLRSAPRTSEERRFFEDPEVRERVVATVAEGGAEGFFYRRGWEKTLRSLVSKAHIRGRVESDAERIESLREELAGSKAAIEERTGKEVLHLCYPWHAGGPTARRLAREAGYRTAFFGKLPGAPISLPGSDPQAIRRIGEDYVELLPGKGRTDLAAILRRKWSRRLRGW